MLLILLVLFFAILYVSILIQKGPSINYEVIWKAFWKSIIGDSY